MHFLEACDTNLIPQTQPIAQHVLVHSDHHNVQIVTHNIVDRIVVKSNVSFPYIYMLYIETRISFSLAQLFCFPC
jgi:hypothetical protein